MRLPTFGSLFAGIGGIDLGLERAGWTCKWQVEIDPYCQAVLKKHWPTVPKFGDVRKLSGKELCSVDLIAGGFPCQPVSTAGKQRGKEDPRWLWPQFARIISVLRPRFVLVENVPGLFTHGFGEVLGGLAACGYDAEWDCIPAATFGAPHLRYRIFIVAHANERVLRNQCRGSNRTGRKSSSIIGDDGETESMAYTDSQRCKEYSQFDGETDIGIETSRRNNLGRCGQIVADSESERTQSIQQPRLLSSIEQSSEVVADTQSGRQLHGSPSDKWPPNREGNTSSDGSSLLADSRSDRLALNGEPWNGPQERIFRGRISQDDSGQFWAVEPHLGDLVDGLPPELAGRFIRLAKGVPKRVNKLRCLGNAVVPQVAEWIGRRLLEVAYA